MADSVHEDIVRLAIARVEALSALEGMQGRVVRRNILAGGWESNTPSGDYLVVTGFGTLRTTGVDDENCSYQVAYPLTIGAVYRTTKEWTVDDEDWQMEVTQKLMDAFIDEPLELTYSGASCDTIVLVGGLTSQGLIESFQKIMRQLTFEVLVSQQRT